MTDDAETFDCVACGICCHVGGLVLVTPDDDVPEGLTRSVRTVIGLGAHAHALGYRMMARGACGACMALRSSKGRHLCTIYEDRPAACRDFEAGSQKCRSLRAAAGLDQA